MQRSSTLITSHYSPSIPLHCPLDSSDPLRERSHSLTLPHLWYIDSSSATNASSNHSLPHLYSSFCPWDPLHASRPPPPATPSLVSSHTRIQNFHHSKPSTPHFSPNQVQSLQPHCRQQQPPTLPFAPDYPPKFSYCAQSCGICHTVPSAEPNLYRPILSKIHRACLRFSPDNAVCAVESELCHLIPLKKHEEIRQFATSNKLVALASRAPPAAPMSDTELSQSTVVFGLRMWVLVGIVVGAAFVLLLVLISVLCLLAFRRRRRQRPANPAQQLPTTAPPKNPANVKAPKDIQEVLSHATAAAAPAKTPLAQVLQLPTPPVSEQIVTGKEHHITYPEQQQHPSHRSDGPSPRGNGESRGGLGGGADHAPPAVPEVSHLGWGHWYTLKELETATGMFADGNVIGEGGYGIVYRGVLENGTQVAVKNLLNNRGQAEKEFKVEVEAIGRVRHKNLVRLLGYCAEGNQRMLVYEYVDNGNLEQWLHGDVGPVSPLTWDDRMKIILGTAKGLMYLHEGLEPKVVHRDVKSSNILLDKHWNAKLSDFGLAKLLGSERSYVTTRVMGTFGYVAPEYAGTGMLNETSDIYSFGILIMEIISGRVPVDYNRPPGEVNLVDWLKTMVSTRNSDGVVDPKIPKKPSSRALKKALLVALRCVDPDALKRPRIGHVIHMLEVDDFPYRDDRRGSRAPGQSRLPETPAGGSGQPETDNSGNGGSTQAEPFRWRNPEA